MDQPLNQELQAALKASELRAEALQSRLDGTQGILDAISEAIYIQDAQGCFLDVNEGAVRMYGHPRSMFIGKTPEFVAAPGRNDLDAVGRAFGKALVGEPQQFEFWGLRADGTIFPKDVRLYPGIYLGQLAVVAVAQDISERKRAEQVRDAAYRISEAALEAQDLTTLYRSVHDILRTLIPAENCYIALHDLATNTLSWPYWVDQVDEVPSTRPFGRGLTEYVIRTGQPQLVDEPRLAELAAVGEATFHGTESLAWLGVPLHNDRRVFGALVVQSYDGGYSYLPEDLEILSFVSAQIAMAIDRKAAEEQLRLVSTAMELAQDALFWINAEGEIEFVNEAACQGLGYTREEFLAMRVFDLDPSLTPERFKTMWAEIRAGLSHTRETSQRRKDGTLRPVEVARTILVHQGRELLFSAARDIEARKKTETALQASEEKFSKAFHGSPDAINLTRLDDGTYLDVSQGLETVTGWTREETIGHSALELGIWANPADRERIVALVKAKGEYSGEEIQFRRKDGSLITGLMSGRVIEIDGVRCLLSITRDISDRKAAEAALRYSEDKFSRAFHSSPDAINLTRMKDAAYLEVSEGFEKLFGWTRQEALASTALELNTWVDPRDRQRILDLIQEHGEFTDQEFLFRRKDGSLLTGLMSGKAMEVDGVPCILSITRDISDRKAAEQALHVTEQRLRTVLANSQAVIYQLDPNARFMLSEGLGLAGLGLKPGQVLGMSALELYKDDADLLDQIRLALEGQASRRTTQAASRYFDNLMSPVFDAQGRLESVIGIATDVTDQRQMEEALRQSQKLESLGILAGGIAHDFNNLLTVVLGNLNLAQMHLPENAKAQPYLANMEATVLRATELTKQMLAYSGRGHFLVEPKDLNEVVREVTHLLEVSISKKIRLKFDLEDSLPAIQADAAQVQQVVMNLVTNASDAIGDREGVIHLSTSKVHLADGDLHSSFRGEGLKAGPYVLLEVSDTGIGMTPEVMAKIFDPFFTTKVTGRGLGLSAMLGILRGHGAGLKIVSEVGRGTDFSICFPASPVEIAVPGPDRVQVDAGLLRGRILLVDDEDLILLTIGSALESLGLEVLTASDGLEALELFREASRRPDLVLMDLTMPRMDGREAFRAMHDLDPSVPVVLSSGFTEQDSIQTLSGHNPAAFIQKPYQIKELRQMLKRVLRT